MCINTKCLFIHTFMNIKYRTDKSLQLLKHIFPCSPVPPLSASLSVPGSAVSSSGSRSGVSLVAGSWYNVSCSASGSSPFVFYNWSLGLGPAERDKQVTLSILMGDELWIDTWTNHVINLRQSSNDGCDGHFPALTILTLPTPLISRLVTVL